MEHDTKKKQIRFATETAEKKIREEDTAGGNTIKLHPLNPTEDDIRNSKSNAYTRAQMKTDDIEKPKRSKFAPKMVEFDLPSGTGIVSLRRIALNEETLFRTLAQQVLQLTPYLQAANLKSVTEMYQTISETVTKVIIACTESEDIKVGKLPLMDKLAMFYKIVEITYGPIHSVPTELDDGTEVMVSVDLSKLKIVRPKPSDLLVRVPLVSSFDSEDSYAIIKQPAIEDEMVFYTDDLISQLFCTIHMLSIGGSYITDETLEAIQMLHPDDISAIESAFSDFKKFGIDTNTTVAYGKGKGKESVNVNVTLEKIIIHVVSKASK